MGFESMAMDPFTNETRSRMLERPKPWPEITASTSKPFPESQNQVNPAGLFLQLHFDLPRPTVFDGVVHGFLHAKRGKAQF